MRPSSLSFISPMDDQHVHLRSRRPPSSSATLSTPNALRRYNRSPSQSSLTLGVPPCRWIGCTLALRYRLHLSYTIRSLHQDPPLDSVSQTRRGDTMPFLVASGLDSTDLIFTWLVIDVPLGYTLRPDVAATGGSPIIALRIATVCRIED
ncbi:hypothetical protein BD311DRAFT_314592 [Dichomitus squalens]|uniref:Uncharacterized protein n=1 Tax=Dichomitus squalens TaxID=114155 RepID=A0A4Q9MM54_9APHY|nr:hypothetical protein BD311DRAFT_314592 [Dichomitus squalens]